MKANMYMINVVWYDGCDAYVSKFIVDLNNENYKKDIAEYMDGNGEILKYDPLYPLTFENIVALEVQRQNADRNNLTESELSNILAIERYKEMYF